jgi:FkbM family methyltransferase
MRVLLGDMVGCHIWESGFYEPHIVRLIKQYLTPDTVFFDIGSHVGQYTLMAAPLVAEVHSFEPTPTTFGLLKANVDSNNLHNVQVNQRAVSDREGITEFYVAKSANVGENSLIGCPDSAARITVQCVSLDGYLRERKLNH